MAEADKELVRRHFDEIFNRQNLAACDEIMAEDYVEHAFAQGSCPVRWCNRASSSRRSRQLAMSTA